MGILRQGYRVLRDEGPRSFLATSLGYLWSRLTRAVVRRLPVRLFQFVTPDRITLEVRGLEARFDASFVTPNLDFRNDFRAERELIASFVDDLRDEDVVYDIGANVGLYSAFAGRRLGDKGTVVAIEPNPGPIPYLYENLEANCGEYRLINAAVGKESGWTAIEPSLRTDTHIFARRGVTVRSEPIVRLIRESGLPDPSAVKIDVEGAELSVLEGFGASLNDVRLLYVEVHHMRGERFGSTERDILRLLHRNFDRVNQLARQCRGGGAQTHYRARSA